MKPFAGVLDPPQISFAQFCSRTALIESDDESEQAREVIEANPQKQCLGLLAVAETAMQEAKTKWARFSKWETDVAHSEYCETWYGADVKSVVKACIETCVAITVAKKAVEKADPEKLNELFQIEIPTADKSHHPWWIVPKISVKK